MAVEIADWGNTRSVALKKDCELLMMADFQALASGVFALQRAQPEFIVHGTSTPTHRPDEAAVTSISLRAETFASIKSRFTWLRESRMAASRAKRQLEK
jgi:hypothetical protein